MFPLFYKNCYEGDVVLCGIAFFGVSALHLLLNACVDKMSGLLCYSLKKKCQQEANPLKGIVKHSKVNIFVSIQKLRWLIITISRRMKTTYSILVFSIFFALNSSAQCWQGIYASYQHTHAIKTDGTLWAWGDNEYGKLGDGTTVRKNSPIQIGVDNNWQDIAEGASHTIGLRTDGTLWAWGYNVFGQLGDGTTANKANPVQIGTANDWKSISAGGHYALALKTDGTIWAWGDNHYGQLGDGTTVGKTSPIQIGTANDWKSIHAGGNHAHAIKMDSTHWGWGSNQYGQLGDGTTASKTSPIQIGANSDWEVIFAGSIHCHAIKADNTLWAWGFNPNGNFGDGTTMSTKSPNQIGTDNDWEEIATRHGGHTLGIKTNGTLWAWGLNQYSQLGDGTTVNKSSPIQIGSAMDWQSIVTGYDFSFAIKTDGTLWAWGSNLYGQLGDGTNMDKNTPVEILCSVVGKDGSLQQEALNLYPNPANTFTKIILPNQSSAKLVYDIRNNLGQVVISSQVLPDNFEINVAWLLNGIYLLTVRNGENQISRVLIKM